MLPRMQMELEAAVPALSAANAGVLVDLHDLTLTSLRPHEPEPAGVVVVLSVNLNQERDPLQSDSRRASASKGLARPCRAWSD